MPTIDELRMLQALPLDMKIRRTQQRIKEWVNYYGESGVYVSFSGGKDSTVLLHLVRELYPNVEAVFSDTGLEYPEIQKFAKSFDNVTVLRPAMRFDEVISKYGYPLIGKIVAHNVHIARNFPNGNVVKNVFNQNKRGAYAMYKWLPLASVDFLISEKCCNVMKKAPAQEYSKKTDKVPIFGTMTEESKARQDAWLHGGCNAFEIGNPHSAPMSFWTEQDVLTYIKKNDIQIASVYGDLVYKNNGKTYDETLCDCGAEICTTGCQRTGCIFCCFGAHLEKKGEGRFERLKKTHPRQYEYCLEGGAYDTDGLWKPKDGLGMKHVFDTVNKIYGKDFIRY